MKGILEAFGIEGEMVKLEGGQNTSVKVGDYVLKPVGDPIYAEWVLSVFDGLQSDKYRISRPIRAFNGKYIYRGFMACSYEPAEDCHGRLTDKIQVAKALNEDLHSFSYEGSPKSNDPWSKSHRIVWGESLPEHMDDEVKAHLEPLLNKLSCRKKDDFQILHSDLYGNILFHDDLSPLVIDFSPTIGPAEYAIAIMICDGIAWDGCDISYLNNIEEKELILRASLFRLITIALVPELTKDRFFEEVKAYERILNWSNENS